MSEGWRTSLRRTSLSSASANSVPGVWGPGLPSGPTSPLGMGRDMTLLTSPTSPALTGSEATATSSDSLSSGSRSTSRD
jgi:hypothetical protein